MQMAWYVKKVSLIVSIKVGDTVNFEIEDTRGSEVLTKLERSNLVKQPQTELRGK